MGGEWNSIRKDPAATRLKLALVFPDTYEVGMSHLGLKILYDLLNRNPDYLVERVFAVPGTGQLLADSVFARDLPTVLGLTLASGVAVVVATLGADALAALADPRIVDAEES